MYEFLTAHHFIGVFIFLPPGLEQATLCTLPSDTNHSAVHPYRLYFQQPFGRNETVYT